MQRTRTRRFIPTHPTCETLEQRTLLSGLHWPASLSPALIHGIHPQASKTDPAAVAAIISALEGGPGSEFVSLIRKQIKNPLALIKKFENGTTTQASINGIAARIATIVSTFNGSHYDYQAAVAAGVVLLPKQTLELGAILRGPNNSPAPAYFTFGINRGSGANVGPYFSAVPGITPDALVTVTVGPFGQSASGTITDLNTGSVSTINPSQILIQGSTLRVRVSTSQLPSAGFSISHYQFAFWTQDRLGHDFGTVGSALPGSNMIRIGVEPGVKTR
jgi:hypothetical protein